LSAVKVGGDDEALAEWIDRASRFVATRPSK
jgi:hypothetical protein